MGIRSIGAVMEDKNRELPPARLQEDDSVEWGVKLGPIVWE
jgi:hypothetical protein